MRRSWWTAIVLAASLVGCRGEDVAPPDLRRPVEALPGGARAVLLTSDLRNTWQRVEAHDLRTVLENWPGTAKVMQDSAVARLEATCREFEAKTGTRLQADLVLNLIGDRAGVALYPRPHAAGDTPAPDATDAGAALQNDDVLLVAELQDAARFRAALAALGTPVVKNAPVVVEEAFDGAPAWRVELDGRSCRIVQQDNFVAAGTNDELVRQALALHSGAGGATAALRDSVLQTALRAIGPHNVVGLAALDSGAWSANGFTWDPSGLHFDQTASLAAPPGRQASLAPEVWASIPDGMTFAALVRHRDLNWRELGKSLRMSAAAPGGTTRVAGSGPMSMLPDLSRPGWAMLSESRCTASSRRPWRRCRTSPSSSKCATRPRRTPISAVWKPDCAAFRSVLWAVASRMCTTAAGPIAAWCNRCRNP